MYTFKIYEYVDTDDWYEFISYRWFVIWFVWAPTVVLMVGAATFAVKRLILHPKPPEQMKKKAKRRTTEGGGRRVVTNPRRGWLV